MSLDTIVRADSQPVTGVDDLIRLLNSERIGRAIMIEVLRRGTLRTFEVAPLELAVTHTVATRSPVLSSTLACHITDSHPETPRLAG